MSGTYANALPGVPISLNAIRAASEQIAATPRVVPDITVARDIWEALRAGLPVSAEAPMSLANLLRSLPPSGGMHVPAEIREAAERKARRAALGCCPCGFARGEDYCPICEGIIGPLGQHLRDQGSSLAEVVAAERVIVEAAADYTRAGMTVSARTLAEMWLDVTLRNEARGTPRAAADALAALTKKATPPVQGQRRAPNRFERRRAASRRWKR